MSQTPQLPVPEVVLSVAAPRAPLRRHVPEAVKGPADIDFLQPRKLAIGGVAGDAALFAELRADVIERLLAAQARLEQRGEAPILGLAPEADVPEELRLGPDVPGGALLLFDDRRAATAVGVVVPLPAVYSARILWVCDESAPADAVDALGDAIVHNAGAWAAYEQRAGGGPAPVEAAGDRPTWEAAGGGFGRLRCGFRLPDFQAALAARAPR